MDNNPPMDQIDGARLCIWPLCNYLATTFRELEDHYAREHLKLRTPIRTTQERKERDD